MALISVYLLYFTFVVFNLSFGVLKENKTIFRIEFNKKYIIVIIYAIYNTHKEKILNLYNW